MAARSYADFDPGIQFAVWTLVHDGLQVPPYTAHPEGDGALRTLGLTAGDWRAWMQGFVADRCRNFDPVSTWRSADAVGAALARLWLDY
jgi:hypothetical protein